LKYWAEKLKSAEPTDFAFIEKDYMNSAGAVGNALYETNLEYLKKADKHAIGTKARIIDLLKFVYHYSNYTHDCFIEAGQEVQAKKNLKPFWASYGNEIIDHLDMLDDFQIYSVLRLLKQSQAIGLRIKEDWVSTLENMIRPPDPMLISKVKDQLKAAEENLAGEETIAALVLADQALELMLRDLCTRFGCDDNTLNKEEEPFRQWGFTDYITFLSSNKEINQYEKANFFSIHDWRNSAHHIGLEPSVRSVRTVIDEIERFLEEHYE
jgi:hypothetical protein